MTCPTPRDVARARAGALIREAVDRVFREHRVREWNDQYDAMVAGILRAADVYACGVIIEVAVDANYIAAHPHGGIDLGTAAVYFLDGAGSGPHLRRINIEQLREQQS